VDNYDSFTNNLCQIIGALNQATPPRVVTNATPWAEVQRLIDRHKVDAASPLELPHCFLIGTLLQNDLRAAPQQTDACPHKKTLFKCRARVSATEHRVQAFRQRTDPPRLALRRVEGVDYPPNDHLQLLRIWKQVAVQERPIHLMRLDLDVCQPRLARKLKRKPRQLIQ
jgi:hypothetical protein